MKKHTMTHVTPQTAAALKAAGFPQPLQTPAVGQVWYDTAGTPYHITAADGERCDYVVNGTLFIDRYLFNEVFAPTAEDILNALGMGWCGMVFSPPEESPQSWCCCYFEGGRFSKHRWSASLAEACASAYLDKHPLK